MAEFKLDGAIFFGDAIQLYTTYDGMPEGPDNRVLPDPERFVITVNGKRAEIIQGGADEEDGWAYLNLGSDIPKNAKVVISYTDPGGDDGVIKSWDGTNLQSGTVTAAFYPGLITTLGPGAIRGATANIVALYSKIEELDVELRVISDFLTPGTVLETFSDGRFTGQFKPVYFFDNPNYDLTATTGVASYKYCHIMASGTVKQTELNSKKGDVLPVSNLDITANPLLINSWNLSLVCTNEGDPVTITSTKWNEEVEVIIPGRYHPPGSTYTEEVFSLIDYTLADNKYLPLWMTIHTMTFNTEGAFNSKRSIYGSEVADFITTYDGNDLIDGNGGNDEIDSGAGNDNVTGGLGNDKIDSGAGNDNVTGGLGNDDIQTDDGNDTVDAGAGDDLIVGGDGAGSDTYNGGIGIDTVKYTSALAGITVDLSKGTAKSTVGTDTAGIGSDKLSNIENTIAGNYNDFITGSKVSNTLTGGLGNDTFVFNTKLGATNIDTITDFKSGTDKLALGKTIFKAFAKDATIAGKFIEGSAAIDANDYLIYDASSGKLYYDADGSATKSSPIEVAIIGIDSHATLTASDFVIV